MHDCERYPANKHWRVGSGSIFEHQVPGHREATPYCMIISNHSDEARGCGVD